MLMFSLSRISGDSPVAGQTAEAQKGVSFFFFWCLVSDAAAVVMHGAGERKAATINGELWHACAGPLVSLPPVGSLVVYFPQGHSEQVSSSVRHHASSS